MHTVIFQESFILSTLKKPFTRSLSLNTSSFNKHTQPTQKLKSWREIPGPSSLPVIGPFLNFLPGGVLSGYKGIQLFEQVHKLYGPIARIDGIFGNYDTIWLSDPDAVAHILRGENTMPVRPTVPSFEYYHKKHKKTYVPNQITGLGTDHGETWKVFRSKVNHIFLQPKAIKLYKNVLAEVADDMIKRMKSIRDENFMIKENFDVEAKLWALESLGLITFGTRLNCLDPNLPENSDVKKLVQNISDFFAIAAKVDYGPSPWRYFSTKNFRKAMKIYEEYERLTSSFVDNAIKNIIESNQNDNDALDTEKPILEKLLETDAQVARIMASEMLLGGADTVSITVLATLYLLAKNPEQQRKLRKEVLTQQDRRSYLRACIKESMRMMPAGSASHRLTTKEYHLLGYKIPKDVLMILSHQYMSGLEEHYPNPDEFIPERWLVEKEHPLYYGNAHPFVTAPFGFGVRMCLGRSDRKKERFILAP
ncbi:cytochrome P450 CYP12A2-like [Choristoneura fumiferana]|uniref:cytochrome P450 CYP12A2-like n=1 Tax=Choristoneura fumiferana TaxID=7141 RepID=UPI003D15C947